MNCYVDARSAATYGQIFSQDFVEQGFTLGIETFIENSNLRQRRVPINELPPDSSPTKMALSELSSDLTPNTSHLHDAHRLFLESPEKGVVRSATKNYAQTLAFVAEQSGAKNTIILSEYNEARKVNEARRQRASGKRVIIRDNGVVDI